MPDWALAWEQLKLLLVPLGSLSVIIIGISTFISKFFADRSIEKKKSELGQETEKLKSSLNQELARLTALLTRDTNNELERLRSILIQENDIFRLKLKKQELIFNLELAAVIEFMKLSHQIWPAYSRPDMDWDEASTEAAQDLGKTEELITKYIIMHGAVLSDEALNNIKDLQQTAATYKFSFYSEGQDVETVTKKAGDLLIKIKEIEKYMLDRLRKSMM